jgi:hypothetical protein
VSSGFETESLKKNVVEEKLLNKLASASEEQHDKGTECCSVNKGRQWILNVAQEKPKPEPGSTKSLQNCREEKQPLKL